MARTSKLRPVSSDEPAPRPAATDQIRLTADRILVKVPDESERRSKGGLLIPATAANPIKRCVWSDVIQVGPETRNVKTGDRVLFIPHSALEVDVNGEVFLLLRERDIQAVSSSRKDRHAGQYL
ncbi:MAG: co-chaperone GroES [Actinomycetota bacterium]